MTKRYYEDFEVGARFATPTRTITEVQIAQWAGLSGDFNELHMSEPYAQASPFGRRIAHGGVGLAIMSGMCNSVWDEGGRALLGIGWSFVKPLFIGDTVHCELEVLEKTPSRSGRAGSVNFRIELVKQDGSAAQSGEMRILFYPRTPHATGAVASGSRV